MTLDADIMRLIERCAALGHLIEMLDEDVCVRLLLWCAAQEWGTA